jgi:serine/threonine protein kinase
MACLRDRIGEHVLLDGRFETIAPLNHGSFGMVFMAKDHSTNETVAIKCLTKKSATADVGFNLAVDDKSEELALHRHLGKHSNIVSLVHSFETDAHVYLVIEFCSRGDLYEAILKGQGPMETERVRQFMLELVDAVAFMHAKGIYHRDIKPENVFLTQSGTPKLGDFGLATTDKWSMETAVGSDRYMSPEQYDSAGAGYSPGQADIWALGICLLNILFSRNPFESPTEADRIFLDFSRDRQSLFDVFPTMSQDTYDVLMQCLSLDPKKRSLQGLRAALERVVSFTTDDEALDDFCNTDNQVGASCNREPLRTPSLQTLQSCDGAFPWHRALRTSKPARRLDTILDNEDLFPRSEESTADWFVGAGNTPSTASILGSTLGASMESLPRGRPIEAPRPIAARVSPMAGSLPITMSRPRPIPSLAAFGSAKQGFSKSWSEMWEEDEEEELEMQRNPKLDTLEINSRTYSSESRQDDTVVASQDEEAMDDLDELVEDGFFMHDAVAPAKPAAKPVGISDTARQSPLRPKDYSGVDKWAALGERRRAYAGNSDKSPDMKTRRQFGGFSLASGIGNGHVYGTGAGSTIGASCGWDQHVGSSTYNFFATKDRTRDRPSFNKARDWNWRRDMKRAGAGDVEWVGGWQDAH